MTDSVSSAPAAVSTRPFKGCPVQAGACAHTYGCHDIWQFWQTGREVVNGASLPWRQAIQLSGAGQIQYVRALVESRPYFNRSADQSLLASDAGISAEPIQAATGSDDSYAFIYLPLGQRVTIHMDKISGPAAKASWYDPRNGKWKTTGEFPNDGRRQFTPPSSGTGHDWVLVLDNVRKNSGNR